MIVTVGLLMIICKLVVRKMGSLEQKNQQKIISDAIPKKSHIPEYAKDFKRE